jgi:hypothetical protein
MGRNFGQSGGTGQFYYVVLMTGVTLPLFELLPEADRRLEMSKLRIERYPSGRVIYERGGDCMDASSYR